jgi:hypothetical protein
MVSLANLTLERVFSQPGLMGVPASPLQTAIVRAAAGLPVAGAIDRDTSAKHFGVERLPTERPRRVVLICGIRGGKSTMGVAAAIWACLTADLSSLPAHEVARYAIIGPAVDAADATYKQLVGYLQSSPARSAVLARDPTESRVVVRRPDGRVVEIVVVAAHRGGLSVRNRWLIGLTLEEVASFGSEATGAAISAEEILRAAETRLLPGCQAWLISSPFGPVGMLHALYQKYFGKPGTTLVVHAPTRALNPSFPQSRIDEIARDDPDTAAREYGAEWIDADSSYLPALLVDKAIRDAPLVRMGTAFAAAMDPATRGNAWTLAVGWSEQEWIPVEERVDDFEGNAVAVTRTRVTIAAVWQWVGSKKAPLSPRDVLRQMASLLSPFGVATVYSDQWSIDALADHGRAMGLDIVEHEGKIDAPYARLRAMLQNSLIELPPDPVMRQDLLSIRQRATANGIKVHLPLTSDGRHCDFAPAVALCAHYAEQLRPVRYDFDAVPDHRHTPPAAAQASVRGQLPPTDDDGSGDLGGRGGGMGGCF